MALFLAVLTVVGLSVLAVHNDKEYDVADVLIIVGKGAILTVLIAIVVQVFFCIRRVVIGYHRIC